jgi:predicted DNA-binding transcriptional regulator AlpA
MEILDNPNALETQRVVSEPEAAAFIGLSLPQLRRLRRQRQAPDHVCLSQRRLGYRIAALIAFLDSRTVDQSTAAR